MNPSTIPHEPTALRALDADLVAVAKAQGALMEALKNAAQTARQHSAPALSEQLEQAHDEMSTNLGRTNWSLNIVKQRLRSRASQAAAR